MFFSKTEYRKREYSFYAPIYGNYKFDTDLTKFGMMLERKTRKVNRKGSILKLKSSRDYKSVYPMLDEFGYTFMDFFIFRSTWDQGYHFETIVPEPAQEVDFDISKLEDSPDRLLRGKQKLEGYSIGRAFAQSRSQNNIGR